MIQFSRIEQATIAKNPFEWSLIDGLFTSGDASALTASFPNDHFKWVKGYNTDRSYEYQARSLIRMGATASANVRHLSEVWRQLATDLLSAPYRIALSRLLQRDMAFLPMEVNVFRYGPGTWLSPHVDLEDKIVTHVFYFNDAWDIKDGGNLTILRSADSKDIAALIPPIVGTSALLVRSEKSWHAVSPVAASCSVPRLSMTVTFYRPGSVGTMWPAFHQRILRCFAYWKR